MIVPVLVGCFTQDLWNHFERPASDTSLPSQGIERLLLDDEAGLLRHVGTTGGLRSPQYLEVHPRLPVLYAAEFTRPGRIASFDIHPDGRLTPQSARESLGTMAVGVSVNPSGSAVYIAHLGDGTLTTCALDDAGALIGTEVVTTSPVGVDSAASSGARFDYTGSGSKFHQVRATPDGRGLVVTDVGRDEISSYALSPRGAVSRRPTARIRFPPGSAPRHVEFSPTGRFVYVVAEQDSHLYVLEAHDHVPEEIIDRHHVMPAPFGGDSLPSELHMHPDGETLFVGVRRADCVVAFALDESGGVELLYREPTRGRNPRAVRVDPTGRHLLVGNWDSNEIAVFEIGTDRGLTPVGPTVPVPSPSSIVFPAVSPSPAYQ